MPLVGLVTLTEELHRGQAKATGPPSGVSPAFLSFCDAAAPFRLKYMHDFVQTCSLPLSELIKPVSALANEVLSWVARYILGGNNHMKIVFLKSGGFIFFSM